MTLNTWLPLTQHLDVGHSQLAHYQVGAGPDVVFVHGWPLHAATFRGTAKALSDRYTCHLLDLPGCGQSRWGPSSQISIEAHARSLRAAIDKLGLSRYALISHDSGGTIARLLAADDPRVCALIMGNTETPGHKPKGVDIALKLNRIPGFGLAIRTLLRSERARKSKNGLGECFSDLSAMDGEFHELFIEPLIRSSQALAGQRRLLDDFDWSVVDRLDQCHRKIKAPTCLIWGKEDRWFPLRNAEAMKDQFAGGCELHVISPAKLFVHEEQVEAFSRYAAAHLDRCMAPANA